MNLDPVRSIAALSSRWRNRFLRSKESPEHLRRGVRGEKLACQFLRNHGYKILYRNFRDRTGGEIDVVCRDGDTLVFVEVKTRGGEDFGRPVEAVDRQKQLRVSKGGLAWLRLLDNPDIVFRFDVVEVLLPNEQNPRLELIQNAFELSQPYIY
ncbi:MAG TPA: YraN family protein [Chthoniobacterales bacterium]|nr:YraN family protein [Chthoniobacterales bacterium]